MTRLIRAAAGPVATTPTTRFNAGNISSTGIEKLVHVYLSNITSSPIAVTATVTTATGTLIRLLGGFSVPANTPVPLDLIFPFQSGDVLTDTATATGVDISYAVELD